MKRTNKKSNRRLTLLLAYLCASTGVLYAAEGDSDPVWPDVSAIKAATATVDSVFGTITAPSASPIIAVDAEGQKIALKQPLTVSASAEVKNILKDNNGYWQKQYSADVAGLKAESLSGADIAAGASFSASTDKGNASAIQLSGALGEGNIAATISSKEAAAGVKALPGIGGNYTAAAGTVDENGRVIASGNAVAITAGQIGSSQNYQADTQTLAQAVSLEVGDINLSAGAQAFGGDAKAISNISATDNGVNRGDIKNSRDVWSFSDDTYYNESASGNIKISAQADSIGGNAAGIEAGGIDGKNVELTVSAVTKSGEQLKLDENNTPVLKQDKDGKPIAGQYVFEKIEAGNAVGVDASGISADSDIALNVQAEGANASGVVVNGIMITDPGDEWKTSKSLTADIAAIANGSAATATAAAGEGYRAVGISAKGENDFGDISVGTADMRVTAVANAYSIDMGTAEEPDIKTYGGNAVGVEAAQLSANNIAETTHLAAIAAGGKDTDSVNATALNISENIRIGEGGADVDAEMSVSLFNLDKDNNLNPDRDEAPLRDGFMGGVYEASAGTYDAGQKAVVASGTATAINVAGDLAGSFDVILPAAAKNPEVIQETYGLQGSRVDLTAAAQAAGGDAVGVSIGGDIDTRVTIRQESVVGGEAQAPVLIEQQAGSVKMAVAATSNEGNATGIAVGGIKTGELALDIAANVSSGAGDAVGLNAADLKVGQSVLQEKLDEDGEVILDADKNPVMEEVFNNAAIQAKIAAVSAEGNATALTTGASDFALQADIYAEALKGSAVGIDLTNDQGAKLALSGSVQAVSDSDITPPTALHSAGDLDLTLGDGALLLATNSESDKKFKGRVNYGNALKADKSAAVSVEGRATMKGDVIVANDLTVKSGALGVQGDIVQAKTLTADKNGDGQLLLHSHDGKATFLDIEALSADSKKGQELVSMAGSATALVGDQADVMSRETADLVFEGDVPKDSLNGQSIQYSYFYNEETGNLAHRVEKLSYFADAAVRPNAKAMG